MSEQWIAMIAFVVVVMLSAIQLNIIQREKDPTTEEMKQEISKLKADLKDESEHRWLLSNWNAQHVKRLREVEEELKITKLELINTNDKILNYQRALLRSFDNEART